MDETAIKVDNVSKVFKLPREKSTTIKSAVVNFWRRDHGYEMQKALDNVSFEVKKGEFFGIVGRNGSGKSTLLKLLAGIYSPTRGSIQVNGSLTPFIELGVGFNPELTGRENVYLNGALLGFNRKEMDSMYQDIVSFAELEKFMDQKLKNYSSGMQVRLAFSIAIRAQSDILLIDEVLAVGDANFQRKCYDYFSNIKRQNRTVVFVSHDMEAVRNFCDKVVLIDIGRMTATGTPYNVTEKYAQLSLEAIDVARGGQDEVTQVGKGQVHIEKVWTSLGGKTKNVFEPRQKIQFKIQFTAREALDEPVVGISLQDTQDRVVFATNTKEEGLKLGGLEAEEQRTVTFEVDNLLTNGTYFLSCAVAENRLVRTYARMEKAHTVILGGWHMPHSMAHLPTKTSFE